jgi:hypothetical protein
MQKSDGTLTITTAGYSEAVQPDDTQKEAWVLA